MTHPESTDWSFPTALAREAIDRALREDLPGGIDVTSEFLFSPDHRSSGVFLVKSDGVIAGLPIMPLVYQALGAEVRIDRRLAEGAAVTKGTVVAHVAGPTRALLTGERTVLNFMQRMSGIATATQSYVTKLTGTGARVADTRKTTPGLRALEKYAVRVGGGSNHRPDLSSAVMIKDNHLAGFQNQWDEVRRLRRTLPHWIKLEVEVESLEHAKAAVEAGADLLLLDNMKPAALEEVVQALGHRVMLEASGGITLETIADVAATGVHVISVGALTHSVRSMDISFDLDNGTPAT